MFKKIILFLTVIVFVMSLTNTYARVIYSSECNSSINVLNTLKQYYKASLSQIQGKQIDARKLDNLQIYSKRVNYGSKNSNLCVFYVDPYDLGLDKVASNQFYFFSDGVFLYPTVLDTTSGMDLKTYMFSKLEKISFDSYKGIRIDEGNKRSDNEIVLFLSLECPHCASLYSSLYYYLMQIKKNIPELNNSVKDFNFFVFLTSKDVNKVKFFKGLQDKGINIGTILFDYFNNQNLMLGNADSVINYYFTNYLSKAGDFKSLGDLENIVKKAEVNSMMNEFNRLGVDATPVSFINNQPIVGADISVINVLLKESGIADLTEIDRVMKEYNKRIQEQKQKQPKDKQ